MVAFSQQRLGFVECALRVELMARRLACLKGASHIFDGNRWQTINRFDIDTRFFFFFFGTCLPPCREVEAQGSRERDARLELDGLCEFVYMAIRNTAICIFFFMLYINVT